MHNAYQDEERARAYASLGFTGTYYLAFRDLPELIRRHGAGSRNALDFGCGAGRSTRFLRELGFETIGIDVSAAMLAQARAADPAGTYLHIQDDAATGWPAGPFDLTLAAFPFDNIGDVAHRIRLLTALRTRLEPRGVLVLVASAPELYTHEWVSHTTAAFRAENARRRPGEVVRVVIRHGGDGRPVHDQLWRDADYRAHFAAAGFRVLELVQPLGRADEPIDWQSETTLSPWLIYACTPER
jgi:trans-aconitate methyltransferase